MNSASSSASREEVVRGYYAALAAGPATLDWDRWFAPDVIQEELPNRLSPPELAATWRGCGKPRNGDRRC